MGHRTCSMMHSACFPNKAALEEFLHLGLRDRILSVGGEDSLAFRGGCSPNENFECPGSRLIKFDIHRPKIDQVRHS